MSQIKVKVTLGSVTHTLETEDYRHPWNEKCDEDGEMEEGDEYPPVPEDFAVKRFVEELNDGTVDVAEVLESATIEVEKL